MGRVMRQRMDELDAQAPVGGQRAQHRPVRHRRAGAQPQDLRADGAVQRHVRRDGRALGRFFRENGLYTFVRWNTFFTNPPLVITEAQLDEGMEIIDKGLEITDRAVVA